MAELTSDGYVRKRLSEWLAEIKADLVSIFGSNIDLSNDSPDGQIAGIMAEIFSDLDQLGENIYNAFDPQASGDVSLSKLVLINGIAKKEATNTVSDVTLAGNNGTVVPAGSIIRTSDTEEDFTLDANVTLTGGSDAGTVTAVNLGPISALAGTLTIIANPLAGWISVTNATDATEGQDEETDEELRIRRSKATASSAKSVVDGIFGSLSKLDNVTGLRVLENNTSTDVDSQVTLNLVTDFQAGNTIDLDINGVAITQATWQGTHVTTIADLDAKILAHADIDAVLSNDTSPGSEYVIDGVTGTTLIIDNIVIGGTAMSHTLITDEAPILAHGIHVIIDGGDNTEIAETIFASKSGGCQTTGEESEIVVDDQGGNNTMNFSNPADFDVEIEVDVVKDATVFPSDGDQLIKDALVAYGDANLNIGDDVIISRLYTPINSIQGHYVTSLQISRAGESLGTSNLTISIVEIAKILDANITVNVT